MTIDVTAVNDAPAIAANTGATVVKGSDGNVITTAMLNKDDPDDSGAGLTYTVTSIVTNGTLRLNGTALVNDDAFTQADVDAGLVTYDHDGSNTISDSFAFSLADGGEDGAAAATGNFSITITAVDDDAPTQVDNTGSGTIIDDFETSERDNPLAEGPADSVPEEDFQEEDDLTAAPDNYLTLGDASTEESPSVLTPEAKNENKTEIIFMTDGDDNDADIVVKLREDDRAFTYYENDFFKWVDTGKFLPFNARTIEMPLASSESTNNGIEFDKDSSDPLVSHNNYDLLREEIDDAFRAEQEANSAKVTIVIVFMTTLTVGIVSYLLRAGALIAGMVSTLPFWRDFDPIIIFSGRKKEKRQPKAPAENAGQPTERLFDREQ
ncbi:cadherin-like domain-containing protein [Desulfosarcina ovata]